MRSQSAHLASTFAMHLWINKVLAVIVLGTAAELAFSQPTSESTPPLPSDPSSTDDKFANISVEEAIRLTSAKLDQLDQPATVDDPQALADEVRKLVAIINEKDPNNTQLTYLRARIEVQANRPQNAISYLSSFIETREGKTEWRAHVMMGDLFVDEYPNLARGHYERAKNLNPGDPGIAYGLSQCAFKSGDLPLALQLATDAVTLDGRKSTKFIAQLTRVLVSMRRWSEAENEAQTALNIAQIELRNHPGQRGPVESAIDQYELLIEIVQAKIGLVPKPGNARNNPAAPPPLSSAEDYIKLAEYIRSRAELSVLLAKFDVLRILEQAIRGLVPNVPIRLAEEHAIALADVGRKDAAITAFENILKNNADNTKAKDWLEKLRSQK